MTVSKFALFIIMSASFLCNAQQTIEERTLSKELTKAVIDINSKGAQILDKETRLDSAATFRNFIIYNNTLINYTAEQLDVKVINPIIEKSVLGTLCAKNGLKIFMKLGVIMVYRYRGKNGQFVTELSKDMSSCKKERKVKLGKSNAKN